MNNRKKRTHALGVMFSTIGVIMILFSSILFAYNTYIEKTAEKYSASAYEKLEEKRKNEKINKKENHQPDFIAAPDMEMPVEEVDGRYYIGTIKIIPLGISLPVQSELDDIKMKFTPCRFEGSVYSGDIILGAHSFRYHFGYLYKLETGDKVEFTDVDGNRFEYKVLYNEILYPDQVNELRSGEWDMTLFTCTIGGRQRIVTRLQLEKYYSV